MIVEKKITVGDIVTAAALLVTIFSALGSWYLDRQLHRREQANKIRAAAANTLVKFDRWQQVSLSFFDKALVEYDDIKQQLYKNYEFQANRNALWEKLLEDEAAMRKTHLEDHVELGYVDLYGYNPAIREVIAKLLADAEKQERVACDNARKTSQDRICKLFGRCGVKDSPTPKDKYDPADLYNQLADDTKQQVGDYGKTLTECLNPSTNPPKP